MRQQHFPPRLVGVDLSHLHAEARSHGEKELNHKEHEEQKVTPRISCARNARHFLSALRALGGEYFFSASSAYAKASADEYSFLTRRSFSEGGPRLRVPTLGEQ
jgi:hypothetical protein